MGQVRGAIRGAEAVAAAEDKETEGAKSGKKVIYHKYARPKGNETIQKMHSLQIRSSVLFGSFGPLFGLIVFSSRVCLPKSPGTKIRTANASTEHGERRACQLICHLHLRLRHTRVQTKNRANQTSRTKYGQPEQTKQGPRNKTQPTPSRPNPAPRIWIRLGPGGSPIAGTRCAVYFFGRSSCRTNPAWPASYFVSGPMAAAHSKVVRGPGRLT